MKNFQVEFDETVCQWLVHIAEATGQTVENVIENGICQQVASVEESVVKKFTYCEQ